MLRRIFLLAIIISSFFVSLPALAQSANGTSNIPALNPFCWRQKDCIEVRKSYELGDPSLETLKSGFITGSTAAPCSGGTGEEEWGRCLPAGVTKTQISFGGQDKFANMGEFILLMYRYLVTTASIVAAVMIVIAGFQWVTSGGNSETISSAKHRIGGALIGLLIAYLSYFILNTINPALVNFRLPQVWLIRPQSLIPQFCSQVPGAPSGTVKFSYFAGVDEQQKPVVVGSNADFNLAYSNQKDQDGSYTFQCGRRFLVENGGSQACFGSLCSSTPGNRQGCAENFDGTKACQPGELHLNFRIDVGSFEVKEQLGQSASDATLGLSNLVFSKLMDTNWKEPNEKVFGVCQNNDRLYLARNTRAPDIADSSGILNINYYSQSWSDSDSTKIVVKQQPGTNNSYTVYARGYSRLADFENEGWGCAQGGKLVGYIFRTETSVKQSGLDYVKSYGFGLAGQLLFDDKCTKPNLNIGYDRKSGQAVYGVYGKDVKNLNYYIPIDLLRENGLTLNIGLTIDRLQRMISSCDSNPLTIFSASSGDPVE